MNTAKIAWSLAALMLVTGVAMAYHNAPPVDGNTPDPTKPWEQWGPGAGLLVVTCESSGAADPVNPQPAPLAGQGGICYASSQQLLTEAEKKDKKDSLVTEQAGGNPVWSGIEPKCLDGDCAFWSTFVGSDDWFARVGNNAHSCIGSWEQQFLYKELLAYYHGSAPNDNGVSGHVAFFVSDPTLSGSYDAEKDVDELTKLDPLATDAQCSGSNWVGVGDAKK